MDDHECLEVDVSYSSSILAKGSEQWILHAVQVDDEKLFLTALKSKDVGADSFEETFNEEFGRSMDVVSQKHPDALACSLCRSEYDDWNHVFLDMLSEVYKSMSDPSVREVPYSSVPPEIRMEFEIETLEDLGIERDPKDLN